MLRHSPGESARRANSVLAFEASGVDDDYERVLSWYAARTGRPIAAVLPDDPETVCVVDQHQSLNWGNDLGELREGRKAARRRVCAVCDHEGPFAHLQPRPDLGLE